MANQGYEAGKTASAPERWSVQKSFKDHQLIWFLGAIVVAFGAGWEGHKAVQEAGQIQPISQARLDAMEQEKKKLRNELERAQGTIEELTKERSALRGRNAELEQENARLMQEDDQLQQIENEQPAQLDPAIVNIFPGVRVLIFYHHRRTEDARKLAKLLMQTQAQLTLLINQITWNRSESRVIYNHPAFLETVLAIQDLTNQIKFQPPQKDFKLNLNYGDVDVVVVLD